MKQNTNQIYKIELKERTSETLFMKLLQTLLKVPLFCIYNH